MKLFLNFSKKLIRSGDVCYLKKILKKNFILQYSVAVGDCKSFRISMDNDYISPKGHIFKKQHLKAQFSRTIKQCLSEKLAVMEFTWQKVRFSSQNEGMALKPLDFTFAEQLTFSHFKVYPSAVFKLKDIIHQDDFSGSNIGVHYDSLLSTASVNLLYMLSWDVIGFEEMSSHIGTSFSKFNNVGGTAEISSISDTYAQLEFKDCADNSFFRNGKYEAIFLGIGLVSSRLVAIFEYRCAGELQVYVAGSERLKSQTGSSYYFGKIFIDLEDGDIVFGDMIEIITAIITNDKGKLYPQYKRRVVRIEKII
jgi:hypothetical protein